MVALAAAAVSVSLPGSIGLEKDGYTAGGALAVFVLVYLFRPGVKPSAK